LRVSHSGDEQITFEIDETIFSNTTSAGLSSDISRLRHRTYASFKEALLANDQHERFCNWWTAIATSKGRLFQFDFRRGPWDIPWEMLLGILVLDRTRVETTIVRCLGEPETTCKSFWTEAIRIMIIKADAEDLDLDSDVSNILSTWKGLEHELKQAVRKPHVIDAERETIVQELGSYKPHMIWFIGHGSFDDGVYLHLSKHDVLGADEFSELFDLAGHCPEFAVFWACETSMGTKAIRSEKPDLFVALSSKGVGTMVGMQSVIADDAAIVMSGQLFRGIAHGLPLEWAVARARTWLYSVKGEETPTMDWAAPVVWTARRPVAHLQWNQSKLDQLQLQLIGSVSIEKGQHGAGLDAEPPDRDAYDRASQWLPFPVTIVRGNPNSTEHRLWFLHTLKGIQAISDKAVLVVAPGEGPHHKQNLRLWARDLLDRLDERVRLPDEFFTRIDLLTEDAEKGWHWLCSLKDAFIAVIGPPPAHEEWFWAPLLQYSDHRAILTSSEIPVQFKDLRVNYATAGSTVLEVDIDAASREHGELLAALSVLNIPARAEVIEEAGLGWEPGEFFRDWSGLCVKTFGGYVIRADVRNRVLAGADGDTLAQARTSCLKLTELMGHSQKPYLKKLRIDLLLEISEYDQAAGELTDLLHLYSERNEQVSLLRAAQNREYFKLRNGLPASTWFDLARSCLQFGEQGYARLWLNKQPKYKLDIPRKLLLEAELTKNEGDIDRARDLIELAIKKCSEIQRNEKLDERTRKKAGRECLFYRHDRARLIQFQEGNISNAAQEYCKIINFIEREMSVHRDHEMSHLLAVTYRNLGECVFELVEGEPRDRWREAESHFHSALHHEKRVQPVSHLESEIHYQLARLSEKQSKAEEAAEHLRACIASAEESQFGLMATIAKNRLFWIDAKEREASWEESAEKWDLIADSLRRRIKHSWAARTLMNSNVNIAQLLLKEQRIELACQHLQENLQIVRENTRLRRGGDFERIARTLAGLQVIEEDQRGALQYWNLLESEFADAGDYIQAMSWASPGEVWKRSYYYGYE